MENQVQPRILPGFMELLPEDQILFNQMMDTIRRVYEKFGFLPLDTPTIELSEVLLAKAGGETEKQVYRFQKGDHDLSLRFDLTVPLARYVSQHAADLTFPFKRYQISKVFRGERPQKGRFREFYQCDVDIIGSDSLLNEVELIQIVDDVYEALNINVALKINNRKVLAGIAEAIGAAEHMVDITVAIDKLDKIGLENVNAELKEKGLSDESVEKLQPILKMQGSQEEKLATMRSVLTSEVGQKGLDELETIFNYVKALGLKKIKVELDLTLARGLNYYTGAIFEVKALDTPMGSITGGGRYDNLTGIFGMPGLSGVGISFGADRIYDVLNQLELYPADTASSVQLLFINFGAAESAHCLALAREARAAGIATEVYPDAAKMKKQMAYANAQQIPYVALVGESEIAEGVIALKNMTTGEQQKLTIAEAIKVIGG